MSEKTLKRLMNEAIKTAIRIQKCKIYCFILSTPKIISIFILLISVFQLTLIYSGITINAMKEILSYLLIVFSVIGIILDFESKHKISYINKRKSYEAILRLYKDEYINFDKLQSEKQIENLNKLITECEREFDEDENSYFLITNKFALKQYFKSEQSFNWIGDYLSNNK